MFSACGSSITCGKRSRSMATRLIGAGGIDDDHFDAQIAQPGVDAGQAGRQQIGDVPTDDDDRKVNHKPADFTKNLQIARVCITL